MADHKISPEKLEIMTKERKSDHTLKKVRMVFSEGNDRFIITMTPRLLAILNEISADIIHKEDMKQEYEGFRIVDP